MFTSLWEKDDKLSWMWVSIELSGYKNSTIRDFKKSVVSVRTPRLARATQAHGGMGRGKFKGKE